MRKMNAAPARARAPRCSRCSSDVGSTLLLIPAGTLVVLVLGAIAVDLSLLFLAKRQLLDAAASIANDAASAGLEPESLRGDGPPSIDPARAQDAAFASLLAQDVKGLDPAGVRVTTDAATARVTVELAADVERFFGKVAGGNHRVRITARATATGHQR